jgi:hypothetical protein
MFHSKNLGLSLVEVMVALGIGGFLITAITHSILISSNSEILTNQMIDFKAVSSIIIHKSKISNPDKCGQQFLVTSNDCIALPFPIDSSQIPDFIKVGKSIDAKNLLSVAGQIVNGDSSVNGSHFRVCAINSSTICTDISCPMDLYLLMFPQAQSGTYSKRPIIKKVAALNFYGAGKSKCGPSKLLTGWVSPSLEGPPPLGVCKYVTPPNECPLGQYMTGLKIFGINYKSSAGVALPTSNAILNFICCPVAK